MKTSDKVMFSCSLNEQEDLTDCTLSLGLKTYSDWPTFPQVYIDGELIGGLDIVKELVASGEFEAMLPQEKSLASRLQALIEKQPVMVFIKGTPQEPQCGFSRQIVAILNDRHVKYGYFNILSDDDVRQGLKTHVDWPTFPMLFYKGELLGGLDIVKEMIESGEFDQVLTA
jgi:Grx4 family monothiol glutaredoxin